MPWYFDSHLQRQVYLRAKRCAACGETGVNDKLCIDHDRWLLKRGRKPFKNYPNRVLCLSCNHKKGARRYVPFPDGTMWLPGKPVGWRTPNTFRKADSR